MNTRPVTLIARAARVIALATVAVALPACAVTSRAPVPAVAANAVYPGTDWEAIPDPQSVGWAQADLDSVRTRLGQLSTTGFMAIVGGRVLMQYGDVEVVSYLASVRKSILAMLYGNYVASGKVRLDKTLAAMGIDDIGGLTDDEKQATILDLLTARSGVYHEASNSGDDLASAPPRGSQKHGTYQLYSNWDFNAAGDAFELRRDA
jgi:CubicO group peptidase (beta-lactamase class C family)